jgi:hypothetical protein
LQVAGNKSTFNFNSVVLLYLKGLWFTTHVEISSLLRSILGSSRSNLHMKIFILLTSLSRPTDGSLWIQLWRPWSFCVCIWILLNFMH